MDYEVNFKSNTLHMAWKSVPNNEAYSLVVEKCDGVDEFGYDNCYQIFSKRVRNTTRIVETSEQFSDCTTYLLKVFAIDKNNQRQDLGEKFFEKPSTECSEITEIILIIIVVIICILIVLAIAAIIFYYKNCPLHKLQRARSRVCSRLYSKERYIRPYAKEEFIDKVENLMKTCSEQVDGPSFVSSNGHGANTIEESSQRNDMLETIEESPFLNDQYKTKRRMNPSFSSNGKSRNDSLALTDHFELNYKQNWYDSEFSELEQIAQATIQRRTIASCSCLVNRRRNRYHDIVPFDSTRVKLDKPLATSDDSDPSDYINASFITDYVPLGIEMNGSEIQAPPPARRPSENLRRQNSRLSYTRQQSTISNGLGLPVKADAKESPARYIAAQGPDEATIPLFWEMIWQQNVRVIVMLTSLVEGNSFGGSKAKCSLYWPSVVGSVRRYNDLEVQLYDVQEAPDYTVRKFDVSKRVRHRSSETACCGGNREIVHIQYTSWPDRSAPEEPEKLLQLIELTRILADQYMYRCENTLSISSIKPAEKTMMYPSTLDIADENNTTNYYSSVKKAHVSGGQWLVHCSAGVGRTGTFIATDQLMRIVDDPSIKTIDIFNVIYQLRKERRYMVQSSSQYLYVYKCILEYMRRKQKTF